MLARVYVSLFFWGFVIVCMAIFIVGPVVLVLARRLRFCGAETVARPRTVHHRRYVPLYFYSFSLYSTRAHSELVWYGMVWYIDV